MKLYVTRHGETPMNAAHRVCGLTNIDLTEKGIAQAKEAGRSLQDKGIKRIIASPLLRAQHTARLIADEIGIDTIETEQQLIEQNYGIYEIPIGTAKRSTQISASSPYATPAVSPCWT